MKYFKNVPTVITVSGFILLACIVLSAVFTRYPGSLSLEWGLQGGKLSIQGVKGVP
jgi:TRAP-type C4-dicarboxylate transport system permease small subunit